MAKQRAASALSAGRNRDFEVRQRALREKARAAYALAARSSKGAPEPPAKAADEPATDGPEDTVEKKRKE